MNRRNFIIGLFSVTTAALLSLHELGLLSLIPESFRKSSQNSLLNTIGKQYLKNFPERKAQTKYPMPNHVDKDFSVARLASAVQKDYVEQRIIISKQWIVPETSAHFAAYLKEGHHGNY